MEDKYRLYGIVGTAIFHGLILLWLLFTYLTSTLPQELGGIFVNFGNVDAASGLFEPNVQPQEDVLAEESLVKPNPQVEEQILTQDVNQSVYVADAKKKEEERKRKQEEERQKTEAERKRREEQAKADAINRLAAGAFGSTQQSSQGDAASGKGNQGNPFGNSNVGSNQGIGGLGGGMSFSLNGRTAEGLPRPTTSITEEGRIVVNITVNSNGQVIHKEIGAGTNIGNAAMRKASLEAAEKSKFNAIREANNQSGTITYRYQYSSQ